MGNLRLKLYTRVCPRCKEYHKTTTRSYDAICEKCKKPTGYSSSKRLMIK